MILWCFIWLTTYRYNVHYVELKPDEDVVDQVSMKLASCTKILSVQAKVTKEEEEYLVGFLEVLDSEVYRYVTHHILKHANIFISAIWEYVNETSGDKATVGVCLWTCQDIFEWEQDLS